MTQLQEVYDSFFAKTEDNFTGKESLVFAYFKAALSKCYKTVRHSLDYTYDSITFAGSFTDTLDQDEIELIALYMKKEYLRKIIAKLETTKQTIGSKDFHRLPDFVTEYKVKSQAMKDLDEEIEAFKQDFNTYKAR